jgi:hypothetical protein
MAVDSANPPPALVCNKHVVVSYHRMKWGELGPRPKAVSASPFTPALTFNDCQE